MRDDSICVLIIDDEFEHGEAIRAHLRLEHRPLYLVIAEAKKSYVKQALEEAQAKRERKARQKTSHP